MSQWLIFTEERAGRPWLCPPVGGCATAPPGQAGRLTASVRRGFYNYAYFLVMTISMRRLRMEIRTLSEIARITLRSMPSHS